MIERAEQSARDVQDDIAQGDRGAGTSSERRRSRNVLPAFVTIDGPVREAIQAHASPGTGRFAASEANGVIACFRALRETDTQDLSNFLRSL